MSLNFWTEQRALRAAGHDLSLTQMFKLCHDWIRVSRWSPTDFDRNIYKCKFQINFLWMSSSVYLNFALLAKAFASNHPHCGIFGTRTCTGTLARQNHLKAKMSVPRSIPTALQLHCFCSAMRSNLRSWLWTTGAKWSSRSERKPGKACLVPDGSAYPKPQVLGKFYNILIQSSTCLPGNCEELMGLDLPKCKAKSSLCEEDQKKDSHKRTIIKTKLNFPSSAAYGWLLHCLQTQARFFIPSHSAMGLERSERRCAAEVAHSGLAPRL